MYASQRCPLTAQPCPVSQQQCLWPSTSHAWHRRHSATAAAMAQSTTWTTDSSIRCGRRVRVAPLQSDEVLYLAYGSNMNPKVLTGRRFVKPRESLPCSVPHHVLSFGVQGFPYSEPGFATITEMPEQQQQQRSSLQQQQQLNWGRSGSSSASTSSPKPCVHGVIHRVTQREWAYIQATEGVGSKSVGYQVVIVRCQLYDGVTVLEALTLKSAAASMHGTGRQVLPSQRYLQLLQEGSRHHNLNPQYQQWLASLRPYQPSSLQWLVGTAASGAVMLSAAAPAVPVYIASRAFGLMPQPDAPSGTGSSVSGQATRLDSDSQLPPQASSNSSSGSRWRGSSSSSSTDPSGVLPFLSWYINQAQSWTWFVHDTALAPVLGSGCSNEQQQQRQ